MYVHRKGVLAAAASATLAALSFAPGASALTAGTATRVTDHPWAGTSTACDTEIAASKAAGSVVYPDTEVEPYVAVDPKNTSNLVAAWQQDRWNDGGNNGDVASYSSDGGSTWTTPDTQAPFTICAAGTNGTNIFDRGSDPSLAWSSDGNTVYQASLAFDANGPAFGGASSVQVSTSSDKGASWNTPYPVEVDNSTTVLNDKEWITADPRSRHGGDAYLVWDRLVSPSTHANPDAFVHEPAYRGPAMFSETGNHGTSWSTPKIIYDPGQNNQTIDNEIVVDGTTLIDGFVVILNKGGFGNPRSAIDVAVIRSTDGGATWSAPTIVSPLDVAEVSSLSGQPYRTGDLLPQFTVDPTNHDVYVVWQDGRFANGTARVAFSESTDDGTSWSTPIEIDGLTSGAAFTPQINVNSDGTIGVSYYSTENAGAFTSGGGTDEEMVDCSSDCTSASSWSSETPLDSTTFDMTTAPYAEGYFVGDYEGLGASASSTAFAPFFVMAKPDATVCSASSPNGACTDPFSNTATP